MLKNLKTIEKIYVSIYNIKSKELSVFTKEEGEILMATRDKNIWILIVFILAGIVIGGLLGQLAAKVDFLWWLAYGESFGLSQPLQLDLNVIQLTFSLMFKINIASIIGMAIAIFAYRKI